MYCVDDIGRKGRIAVAGAFALATLLVTSSANAADLSGSIDSDELFKPTKHGPPINPARVKLPADFGTSRYFEKRAREKLKHEDEAVAEPPHPLAVGREREALVICEAGCINEAEEVVYTRPRIELKPATYDGHIVATVVSIDAPTKKIDPRAGMDCLAGCK